jgi:hypothetical protein
LYAVKSPDDPAQILKQASTKKIENYLDHLSSSSSLRSSLPHGHPHSLSLPAILALCLSPGDPRRFVRVARRRWCRPSRLTPLGELPGDPRSPSCPLSRRSPTICPRGEEEVVPTEPADAARRGRWRFLAPQRPPLSVLPALSAVICPLYQEAPPPHHGVNQTTSS